ncbi:MAG: hypothetical protein GY946_26460, partial [bacterium]|nr:hypothetical protein [bacterium]
DLAVDDEGSVYVVEPELGRLQKLSPDGCSDEEFLATIAAAPLHHPTQVAILKTGNRTRLLVIEQSSRRARVSKLRVYHSDGRLDEPLTDTLWRTRSMFTAIAAGDTGFFAVDLLAGGPTQQILQFDENGQLLGIIDRVDERVADLALDCKGRLILQSADGSTLSFEGDERFAATGRLLAGPFRIQDFKTQWNRLNLVADVPSGTQLQLETWVTDTELEISEVASSSEASAPLEPEWEAAPPGARDLRVGAEGQFLWIRCELGSNGQATPCLEHLAIRYEMQPWIDRLPAIYKHEETGADLLRRILDLCQSVEEEFRDDVTAMAHEFSPVTAGADGAPSSWLDWLAGWLDLVLDEHWDESLRREITSRAFDLFSRRGTRAGLAELLELFVGVPVTIREPAAAAALWSLGRAPLGCGTMLVPASEQGAILDTTALLDQSHLIDQGDFGAPLFDDIAHCFCVEVRADDIPDEATLLRLKHLVELEKPAHTLAHVCVLEDKFSLGLQNRLGIDTIVGGPPAHGPLGDGRSTSALVLEDSIPNEALTGDAVVGPDTSLG